MTKMTRGRAAAAAIGLGLLALAGTAEAQNNRTIVVTGTLTDEGAECQALRGDNGRLYTLAGDLSGFSIGDRVRVRGRVAEVSFCQQGTTIEVRRIREANRPPR